MRHIAIRHDSGGPTFGPTDRRIERAVPAKTTLPVAPSHFLRVGRLKLSTLQDEPADRLSGGVVHHFAADRAHLDGLNFLGWFFHWLLRGYLSRFFLLLFL